MKLNILKALTPKRRLGNFGERAAARYLFFHGYRILERNYVAAGYEIDLIARKKNVVAFVEVKARTIGKLSPMTPRPAAAVTPEKQRKIISAAKYYHSFNERDKRMRFDVIEVYLDEKKNGKPRVQRIVHMISAFDRDTAYHKRG